MGQNIKTTTVKSKGARGNVKVATASKPKSKKKV